MSKQIKLENKKAIVFSGGGVLGVGTAGALEKINDLGYWSQFKAFAGASVGSIFAVGMAMGANPQYITKLIWDTNFKKFFDDTKMDAGFFDLRRFLKRFGWYKGDELEKFYRMICSDLSGNPDITFQDAYEKFGTEIYMTAYCINDQSTKEFSWRTVPKMPIAIGMRCSSSYPYILAAKKITADEMNRYTNVNNTKYDLMFADGGILNNFPVDLLIKSGYTIEEILGIHLHPDPIQLQQIQQHLPKNIIKYTVDMTKAIFNQAGMMHIPNEIWKETISINTFDIKSMNFNITEVQKSKLFKSGLDSTSVAVATDVILT